MLFEKMFSHFPGVLLLIIFGIGAIVAEDSEAFATACEKRKTTYGYEYNEIFKFSDKSYSNGTLYLTFRVQAASNAHIIFSVGQSLETYGQIYEIVLGAGRNTFSDIRRYIWKRGPVSRAKAVTEDLLSASELREFTISISKDGLIEIRKSSDAVPILYWRDPDPIPIRYFGFSTWNSVYGIWYFDCYGVGSTTIDSTWTPIESLRRDLLQGYDRFAIPLNISDDYKPTPINISFSPYHAELDSEHGQITLVGKFMLAWKDEKLKWDPSKHGNITSLQLVHGEVWKPELVVYNAIDHGINPLGPSGMVVSNKGHVNWNPNSKLQSRCQLKYNSMFSEKHRCEIQLGLWGAHTMFRLVWINDSSQQNNKQMPLKPWLFEDFNATYKWIETPWYDDQGNNDMVVNGENITSVLALAITLEAGDTFYLRAVSFIVIVLTVFFLSIFWIPSCDEFRGCLMLSTALIISPIYKLISYGRPYYVIDITYGCFTLWLVIGSVASMFSAYLKSRPGNIKPNSFVLSIVRFSLSQKLFCLPGNPSEGGDQYRNDITEQENVEEGSERGEINGQWYAQDWKAISVFVTRITFYLSLICIIWYTSHDFN